MSATIVGIDLDNTIIDYRRVFGAEKQLVRDELRRLPNGEQQWMELQAEIYGPRISEAEPFSGILRFIDYCKGTGVHVVIVSHKTEFATAAPDGVNLRTAARGWLDEHGITGSGRVAPGDVHFVSTREEKTATIERLGCTIFIDDLIEVFSDASFPSGVERWLFAPESAAASLTEIATFSSWSALLSALVTSLLRRERIVDVTSIRHGRNSRVFRVRTEKNVFALKGYPPDDRGRFERETGALGFIRDAEPKAPVPQFLCGDESRTHALCEWVDGAVIGNVRDADVTSAVHLLELLHSLRKADHAASLPAAMEACLSLVALFSQIDTRRARLNDINDSALRAFLSERFDPTYDSVRKRSSAADPNSAGELAQEWRTLSPADFGFHNALRRNDGRLIFLDFEYFGWDDPVRAVSDFLLHPGMQLTRDQSTQFREGAAEIYGVDPNFRARFDARHPLFALRWALIVLNEFVPVLWQARVEAGFEQEWSVVKGVQLEKALGFVAVADAG